MRTAQPSSHRGIPSAHPSESPSAVQELPHTTCVTRRAATGHLEIDPPYTAAADPEYISSGVRVVLEDDAQITGLEVDEDGSDQAAEEEEHALAAYAPSMYPGVQPSYQVEHPYEHGHDSATINSARTLYAEDFDFVIENGRQYCGDYFLPIDQTEQTRQYVIHQVYLKLFDLELTTVPLVNPRYILDIGTGIGEWAIGMAEKYPRCEVFGTDIAPIQPTHQVPFNIEFHIENAEEEWIRPPDTVDLVHIRNMEGAFSDWNFIYSQAFTCIKPGGWIEVIDWEDFFAEKNFLSFYEEDSPPYILTKAVLEAAERAGKPRDSRHLDKNLLIRAGFVDIQEREYDMGMGSRANSSYGQLWLFSLMTGVEAMCLRLLTKYMGWDPVDVRRLCEQVARQLKAVAEDPTRADPFVVKLRVVAGRKPMASRWAARSLNENGDISGDESTIGARTIVSEDTM
ncbi:hypothetical protein VTI74DRAFT_9273 [Chaetomium olivicolor]